MIYIMLIYIKASETFIGSMDATSMFSDLTVSKFSKVASISGVLERKISMLTCLPSAVIVIIFSGRYAFV